jgi:hypothetical protein
MPEYRDTISPAKGNRSAITTPMDIDEDTNTNKVAIATSSAPEHAMADALPMSTYGMLECLSAPLPVLTEAHSGHKSRPPEARAGAQGPQGQNHGQQKG